MEAYARFLANNGEFDQSLEVIERLLERGVSNIELEQLAEKVRAKKRPGRMTENAQEALPNCYAAYRPLYRAKGLRSRH